MNCANHPVPASRLLPYLRQTALRRLHPRRSRRGLLRELPGRTLQGVHPTPRRRRGFVPVAPLQFKSGPHPAVAGILAGFFPFGVGAVYSGQYAKGLAHLLIFTLLVWGLSSGHAGGMEPVLGIAMGFFVVYQIIDAVRSAHAIRMGQPRA